MNYKKTQLQLVDVFRCHYNCSLYINSSSKCSWRCNFHLSETVINIYYFILSKPVLHPIMESYMTHEIYSVISKSGRSCYEHKILQTVSSTIQTRNKRALIFCARVQMKNKACFVEATPSDDEPLMDVGGCTKNSAVLSPVGDLVGLPSFVSSPAFFRRWLLVSPTLTGPWLLAVCRI